MNPPAGSSFMLTPPESAAAGGQISDVGMLVPAWADAARIIIIARYLFVLEGMGKCMHTRISNHSVLLRILLEHLAASGSRWSGAFKNRVVTVINNDIMRHAAGLFSRAIVLAVSGLAMPTESQ